MPTHTPVIDHPTIAADAGASVSANARGPAHSTTAPAPQDRGLQLRLSRPTSTCVVMHVAGDIDAHSAPRLDELLAPSLASTAETLVLDLSQVSFFGVAGLELLDHVRQHAASRRIEICIVDGPTCVERALLAAGWSESVPTHPAVTAAIAENSGRNRVSHAPLPR